MIKTLIAADRSERERFRIPHSVQQSIPIQKIYRDGIWQTGGKFSRTWRFADINYALASHDDQRDMFTSYCGVLNSLPTDATTKITINNRRLNGAEFRRSSLVAETSEQIKQLSWQIQTATAELEETVQSASQVLREYDQLIGWAEMYDNCTFEAKKMIVAQFVKEVHVRRDYEIDIEFNVSFEEFQALYLEGEPEEEKRSGADTLLTIEMKTRQAT